MKSDTKTESGVDRVSTSDEDRRDRDRDRDSRDHRDRDREHMAGGLGSGGGRRRGEERGSEGSGSGGEESVCRDFLRSNCRRGRRCRYIHPEGKEGEEGVSDNGSRQFVFCRDYQNSTCRRAGCRFVHCSREDEATYRMTGMLPPHVLEAAIMQGKTGGLPTLSRPGEAPVCRDYLKGECRRGPQSCRFRHLTVREYQEELGYVNQVAAASSPAAAAMVAAAMQQQQQQQQSTYHHQASAAGAAGADNGSAAAAAAASSVSAMQGAVAAHPSTMAAMSAAAAAAAAAAQHPALSAYHHLGQPPPPPPWQVGAVGDIANGTAQHYAAVAPEHYLRFDFPPPMQQPPPPPPSLCVGYEPEPKRSRMDAAASGGEAARIYVLEEENAMLHKKLDDLKKQVQDLTATNEFLLDQNAQLRMASKRQVVPAVSMTSTVPGGAQSLQVQAMEAQMQAAGAAQMAAEADSRWRAASAVPVSMAAVAASVSMAGGVSMAPVQMAAPDRSGKPTSHL